MRIKHKYFRNQAYKQKLVTGKNIARCKCYFLTDEPATNINYYRWWNGASIYWNDTRQCYEYYRTVPDVPYRVMESNDFKRGNWYGTWLKKYRNRSLRHNHKMDLYQNGEYRKVYEYAWDID